jgi:hypothetical protein
LWIWAMLYRPDRGWGFTDSRSTAADASPPPVAIEELSRRVAELERRSRAGVH